MKVSTRFSDSIHLLAFLVIYKGKTTLSSNIIASSLNTSPVVVRRLMSNLRDAGFIKTTHGSPDPELLRETKDISLLEIYLATEGKSPLFAIDHETNPDCIVGCNIQPTLTDYFSHAEIAAEAVLGKISLQDVIDTILVKEAAKKQAENSKDKE